jgi:hypothetical protein
VGAASLPATARIICTARQPRPALFSSKATTMSIYIERALKAVEDLRAFDRRDAARLADELLALRHDPDVPQSIAIAEHIAQHLKGYVDRETVITALKEAL